jgi:L-ascorbate metabolism protein UlaG (beta-lactamase superfamily)
VNPAEGDPPVPERYSLTFVGTATTVLRLGSFTLLTDPNFLHQGQRAYLGKGLWSRRITEPAFGPADLPALDLVVLSHLHGDHFDRVARHGLDRAVPVVTTTQAQRRLRQWGFDAHGLKTWQRHDVSRGREALSIEALPGVHARGVLGRLLPPVMGSLVEHRVDGRVAKRLYISGDTLTGAHLQTIRERHPDVDVAVVHLGGTRVLMHTVTMDDRQGVEFLRVIRPGIAVPVHYDDYPVFRSPLSAFLTAAGQAGLSGSLRVPGRGETIDLAGDRIG